MHSVKTERAFESELEYARSTRESSVLRQIECLLEILPRLQVHIVRKKSRYTLTDAHLAH